VSTEQPDGRRASRSRYGLSRRSKPSNCVALPTHTVVTVGIASGDEVPITVSPSSSSTVITMEPPSAEESRHLDPGGISR